MSSSKKKTIAKKSPKAEHKQSFFKHLDGIMNALSQEVADEGDPVAHEEPLGTTMSGVATKAQAVSNEIEENTEAVTLEESLVHTAEMSGPRAGVTVPIPRTNSILSSESADSVETLIMDEEPETAADIPDLPQNHVLLNTLSNYVSAVNTTVAKKPKEKFIFHFPREDLPSSIVSKQPSTIPPKLVASVLQATSSSAASPTSTASSISHRVGTFAGTRLFIIPNNIEKVRLKLFRERVIEKGGVIEERFEAGITHVVTDLKNLTRISEIIGVKDLPPGMVIVSSLWVSDCIMYGKLLDSEEYLVASSLKRAGLELQDELTDEQNKASTASNKKQKKYSYSTEDEAGSMSESDTEDIVSKQYKENHDSSARAAKYFSGLNTDIVAPEPAREAYSLDMAIAAVKNGEDAIELHEISDGETEEADEQKIVDEEDNGNNKDAEGTEPIQVDRLKKDIHEGFLCMQKNVYGEGDNNPNQYIMDKLKEMLEYYERTKDQWRAIGYRKAISAIKKHGKPISSKKDAISIPGVGGRLAEKIEEIINTGHLQRLDNLGEHADVIKLFTSIYGVGPSLALRWVAQGFRTLDDVRRHAKLTHNQEIGLNYFEELNERMPREEVRRISEVVEKAANGLDPKLECTTMGSYRREQPNCGDIDIIITRDTSDGKTHQGILPKLLKILEDQGFLTDHLATPQDRECMSAKYMGICQLPGGKHRHIDILMVPYNEKGAALIYFTGNDIFNRSLRLLASRMNMRLNQHGLYADVIRGPNRAKMTEGRLIAQQTEQEIFDAMGVPWRPPHERHC